MAEYLAYYYSRTQTELTTRANGVTTTTPIVDSPLVPFGMRYITNPFGIVVDLVGIGIFCVDTAPATENFIAYQRGEDWAYIYVEKIPEDGFLTSRVFFPAPIRLGPTDTILEESSCASGSRSLGVTFYAQQVP